MELEEAKNIINNFRTYYMGGDIPDDTLQKIYNAIDIVLDEFDNLIKLTKAIKTYEVNFENTDNLLLLVDKTIINNGIYETNFVNKEEVKSELDDLIKKLEFAGLGGFVDEVQDIENDLLNLNKE